MDLPRFTPPDYQVEAVRERYRPAAAEFPAGPVVTVVARVLSWLSLTFLALLAMVSAIPWNMPAGEPGQVEHTEPGRALEILIPVLFVLSLIPLVGPGSPKALRAFGVIWLVVVVWLVIGR